jgi:hypothetical protein
MAMNISTITKPTYNRITRINGILTYGFCKIARSRSRDPELDELLNELSRWLLPEFCLFVLSAVGLSGSLNMSAMLKTVAGTSISKKTAMTTIALEVDNVAVNKPSSFSGIPSKTMAMVPNTHAAVWLKSFLNSTPQVLSWE